MDGKADQLVDLQQRIIVKMTKRTAVVSTLTQKEKPQIKKMAMNQIKNQKPMQQLPLPLITLTGHTLHNHQL
jgi:hypothetical protein